VCVCVVCVYQQRIKFKIAVLVYKPIHGLAPQYLVEDREYKSREVLKSPIYVVVHSLLEVSFCTQPFPTPIAVGYGSYGF